jgi:hypothetical protein
MVDAVTKQEKFELSSPENKIRFLNDSHLTEESSKQQFLNTLKGGIKSGDCIQCGDFSTPLLKSKILVNAVMKIFKQHKKKSNQSAAYHKRIQKKWNKRGQKDSGYVQWEGPVVYSMPTKINNLLT